MNIKYITLKQSCEPCFIFINNNKKKDAFKEEDTQNKSVKWMIRERNEREDLKK